MSLIIRNARLVNEGQIQTVDVEIKNGRIEKIASQIGTSANEEVDAKGNYMFPGIIDDQVHFREPGLTHKAQIATESRAAVAGGVTSFMDMPNVDPPSLDSETLERRYDTASRDSIANYSFYLGVSNDNIEEVKKVDIKNVCGVKAFMGSSTGNMLVDDEKTLEALFEHCPTLLAVHCEDEQRIRNRSAAYRADYGEDLAMHLHPEIRDEKACLLSSSYAVHLARKHGTRLHILHISTEEELALFELGPVEDKQITSEACVHHLWFSADDYERLGAGIKCNPAIKAARHRESIRKALVEGRIDVVATDHAPHTAQEKSNPYFSCPSGLPLVQHSINVMLEIHRQGYFDLPFIAGKMCHDVARAYKIRERGYLREGYFADFFLLDRDYSWKVAPENILAKCGWSPFEGQQFRGKVLGTWVNGYQVWDGNQIIERQASQRLLFDR
jgi:dihydroorotase